jgi:hypothetical protein
MAKEYEVKMGFNVKILEEEKDGDFGPGVVQEYNTGFEVRFEEGQKIVAKDIPQKQFNHLKKMGAIVDWVEPEPEEEEEDG